MDLEMMRSSSIRQSVWLLTRMLEVQVLPAQLNIGGELVSTR